MMAKTTVEIKLQYVRWEEITMRAQALAQSLMRNRGSRANVFGVPRGGSTVAAMIGFPVDDPKDADVIADDIIDSGATLDRFRREYPEKPFVALFDKRPGRPDWGRGYLVFPWELGDEDGGPEDAIRRVLQFIGEDPDREGLVDTPQRVLRAWGELAAGYAQDPKEILGRVFHEDAEPGMVVVRDIPFHSICEHHLLPFKGTATVGYIPRQQDDSTVIVGLSKLARLVHCYARRLQVQERMTRQIGEAIEEHLRPTGVGVLVTAAHSCMEMRGISVRAPMATSYLRGALMQEGPARTEFLALARQ